MTAEEVERKPYGMTSFDIDKGDRRTLSDSLFLSWTTRREVQVLDKRVDESRKGGTGRSRIRIIRKQERGKKAKSLPWRM
jgi:hypothetical protein